MYRYHTNSYSRKFRKSICSILETNKEKYIKNKYIIKRYYTSNNNPGGPQGNPWWVLLLCPIALNIIYNLKKSR
jgi:hypothetical protein